MQDQQAAQGSAAPAEKSLKYRDMTPTQKAVFVLKISISVVSFGFLFPHMWGD